MDYEKGTIDTEEFRAYVREGIKGNVSNEEIDEAMAAFLPEIPIEKLNAILEYKKSYRVFLLSNTNPVAIETVKPMFAGGGCPMEDYFEKMYLSYEMKLAKPDIRIFEAVLENSSLVPEETLFVDDSPVNLEAAQKLGIKTALMLQENDLQSDLIPFLC